mmetsp:Transcript_27162/g.90294  ORF Transcript_27162/g.90294 Transcript_27162/m.90294 type:complete len:573 (+) Transcript_27162:91-1809(+)|eukprot:CAMPEP_0203866242 /NCGR_PEP_ID=MMETSP0359-20131031/15832_1 /ASSEMBLY_ACC=CAM_ASM_000338 /TAXON_ID=268821 /ORGANISM="Scrippsiella Hangoei, Strain SHTV-5" /LENGTH=572 /DNA_ID=CAMNT_0050784301 /DNA_START=91 /DNA_END=1809 /DNA_ORIENTATION=+
MAKARAKISAAIMAAVGGIGLLARSADNDGAFASAAPARGPEDMRVRQVGFLAAAPVSAGAAGPAAAGMSSAVVTAGAVGTAVCLAAKRRGAASTSTKARGGDLGRLPSGRAGAATPRRNTAQMQEEQIEEVRGMAGSIVKKTTVLVLGSTGTVGRQVVRQMLNAGYSVRCLIRNKADRPFSFLVDWGASCVDGSLNRLESLPTSLIGVHTVIDCSTAGPEESVYDTDWEGKKFFIQCCEKMEIQRYIFMSIKDCDKFQEVPLMKIKYCTEKLLGNSSLRYTVLRATGFMQPLISEYALSILDDQKVWGDDGSNPGIAYMDSQDCARFIAAAATKERLVGKTITLGGPKVWTSNEVISMCEKLSGRKADINIVSNQLLEATKFVAGGFEWTRDVAERLQFAALNQGKPGIEVAVMSQEAYELLGVDPTNTRKLEDYVGEFYRRVFKKLTKGSYEPEAGEVEKEQDEMDRKAKEVFEGNTKDELSPGQPAEKDVLVDDQREMAEILQDFQELKAIARSNEAVNKWFGLVPIAEVINGRSAMMGFSLGLFTEWATGISVAKQVDQLIAIFQTPS